MTEHPTAPNVFAEAGGKPYRAAIGQGRSRLFSRLGMWASLGSIGLVYAAALWWSPLNQDEGWYLYAARLVSEGQRPYIDFAFTQGPVQPRVYALFAPVFQRWGMAGGRAVTALFGLIALGLSARLAARLAGGTQAQRRSAALVAAWLCGWNVDYVMHTTVVKTYALCALFWTAALLALVSIRRSRAPALHAVGAGLLLALATATRMSAGAAVPVALAWLWAERNTVSRRVGWVFVGALVLGSGWVWIPSALEAPEGLRFALFSYHAGRSSGGILSGIAYRAGSVSRLVRAWFPALALAATPLLFFHRKGTGSTPGYPAGSGWIGLAIMIVGLTHLSAPFPYDDYNTFLFPALAALAACGFTRWAGCTAWAAKSDAPAQRFTALRTGVAALLLLHAVGSPVWQEWAVAGRDRIWWRLRSQSELAGLRDAAERLRAEFPEANRILTQDLYLAVETGWSVPDRLSLGPFAYFPALSDADAERLHVLNRNALEQLLRESNAPVAAFSGYGLSIASPAITELPDAEQARLRSLLEKRYEPLFTITPFGQGATPLDVFRLRTADSPEAGP